MLSSEPFVPHPYSHFSEVKVFPSEIPESFYSKTCKEYEQVTDVATSRIIYKSDGLKVTGISSLPLHSKKQKHPIMIYNRGGNREYGKLTVLSVMRSMIPFAKDGYLVYASNYRGNDGGEGADEFGGSDVGDVMNLIEIAKQNPAWDGANIFMLGHSRGGMMTYILLRINKEITAAVSIAGVADIVQSGIERPEMENNIYKKLIITTEENREQEYAKRSACCWANEIDAPLLLLHGTSDESVNLNHSIKLAEKLSGFKKEHKLVIYENGNHALLRYWNEVLAESRNWFESHRK